jgi:hypothetical protein
MTDVTSSFPLVPIIAAVRRRGGGASGGGGAQRTGQGNNMSMLRYYTDDSPGLKITPVRGRLSHHTIRADRTSEPHSDAHSSFLLFVVVSNTLRFPNPPPLFRQLTGCRADDERVLHRLRHYAPRGVQDLPVYQQVI